MRAWRYRLRAYSHPALDGGEWGQLDASARDRRVIPLGTYSAEPIQQNLFSRTYSAEGCRSCTGFGGNRIAKAPAIMTALPVLVIHVAIKNKVVLVHAIKVYVGSRGIGPVILKPRRYTELTCCYT